MHINELSASLHLGLRQCYLKKLRIVLKSPGRNFSINGNLSRKKPANLESVIRLELLTFAMIANIALIDNAPNIKPRTAPPILSTQPNMIAFINDLKNQAISAAIPITTNKIKMKATTSATFLFEMKVRTSPNCL